MRRTLRRPLLLLAGSLLLLAPLISVQLSVGAGRAYACSCAPPPPPLDALDGASAVFLGKVVSFRTWSFEVDFGDRSKLPYWSVEFEVDVVWKGPVTTTTFVYVTHETACGYSGFEVGEDFLVYAHEWHEATTVSQCSRTEWLEHAAGDLQDLGEGRAPDPGVTGERPASEDAGQTSGTGTSDASTTSEDAGQTSGSEATDAAPTSGDYGQAPGPGTTGAAPTSGDSSGPPAWAIPLLAAIAAALIAIWLVTRPRRRG